MRNQSNLHKNIKFEHDQGQKAMGRRNGKVKYNLDCSSDSESDSESDGEQYHYERGYKTLI